MTLKISKSSIFISILCVFLGVLGTKALMKPEIITVTEYVTQEIDENLWVSRSVYLSERELAQKLRQDSSRFARELRRTRQNLEQSAEIIGNLVLVIDSLSQTNVIDVVESRVDTTLSYVFTDSLLAVTASLQLDSLQLTHRVDLVQLRPLKLQVHTTRDESGVYFYVESNDLIIEEINSFTAIDIPRYKWYHYLGAGVASGVLFWELIR
jgi:hypothetical protein